MKGRLALVVLILLAIAGVAYATSELTVEDRLCRLEALHDIEDPSCGPAPLVIPQTQPYDPNFDPGTSGSTEPNNLDQGEGFMFYVDCDDTAEVTCNRNVSGDTLLTRLVYMGHGMPYVYPGAVQGEHNHGWWVPGDRDGYKCGHAFMYDQHPNPFGTTFDPPREGHFISRATIVRPETQAYGKLIDKYMEESQLKYDGTPWVAGQGGGCVFHGLDDFDYASYVPHGPDDIRIGLFADNPMTSETGDYVISDIRDHTNLWQTNPHHFEFLDFRCSDVPFGVCRATILMIDHNTNGVIEAIYYDTMNDGKMAVEVNGQMVAEG